MHFYTAIIKSNLTFNITIWYADAPAKDKSRLQHIIPSAEKVIGCNLPSLQELSASLRRAGKIVADPSHPRQFEPVPSGRRLWSIRTKTSRHKVCFPSAVSLTNKAPDPH